MSDQYTPGPWKKVTGNKNREFNAIAIRTVSPERKGSSSSIASVFKHPKFGEANANLIAAAPDLLALLKEGRNDLAIAASSWNQNDDRQVAEFHCDRVLGLIKRVDAAILLASRGAA